MYNDSGIYCYRNKVNGKLYVGQAKNLKRRFVNFQNMNRRYAGQIIDNARKKYGIDNFEYSILTHCSVDDLNYWEAFYVERLKSVTPYGYNMTNGGDSVYTSTKEFREKQTEKLKGIILAKNPDLDVSKVQYEGNRIPVTIVCPIHGKFKKTPDYFRNPEINDLCCPQCVREYIRQKSEKTFFREAKKKWGNKYDYTKTTIIDRATHVTITCPIHGDFIVLPGNHISKDKNAGGCPICSRENMYDNIRELTSDKILSQIKEKFGNKYSLEKFAYKSNNDKITLICPEHGEFSMRPGSLVKGLGCPKCSGHYMDEEYFIECAKKIHNNKYDYSKVIYNTSKLKVCIICPEHGEFWQRPKDHLRGSGCPKCGKLIQAANRKKTNEEFIQEAKQIHGVKYDYSKVEYIDYDTQVCIICPEHGEFWQRPKDHLKGAGCKQCRLNEIRLANTRQFIEKAKLVHGDKYDYSKTNYINRNTKLCIICPVHGEVWVTSDSHLRTCGCPKCREEQFKPRITPDEKFINKVNQLYPNRFLFDKCKYINKHTNVILFDNTINDYISIEPDTLLRKIYQSNKLIKQLKEKFGDKYDYSKIDYSTTKTKVTLICPIHGEFSMTPSNLLHGKGCPKCTMENIYSNKDKVSLYIKNYNNDNNLTNEIKFANEANKIHNNKYDYSKVVYKNQQEKVCIICPEHGEFYQTPCNHLQGYGCPKCGQMYRKKRKAILQYDLNNNFIKEWSSYDEIIKSGLCKKWHHICSCCTGKTPTAYGFIWKHKQDDKTEPPILQLTKDNILVREWKDMQEINKTKPIHSTQHIHRCLQGKQKAAGGFIWKYKE